MHSVTLTRAYPAPCLTKSRARVNLLFYLFLEGWGGGREEGGVGGEGERKGGLGILSICSRHESQGRVPGDTPGCSRNAGERSGGVCAPARALGLHA